MPQIQQKPIIHGRDHMPGHPDPIPGLPLLPGSVVYSDFVRSFSSLIGYWRLGETGSPWADTSGVAGGPHNLAIQAHGVAMTPDVTGALPTSQDDGAVKFNYTGTAFNGGDWLATTGTSLYEQNPFTCAGFVRVHAYPGVGSRGQVAGSMSFTGGTTYSGWAFQTMPSGKLKFNLGGVAGVSENTVDSPGALVLDDWYHAAGTYDGANIKLYLNGVLVNTTAYVSGLAIGSSSGMTVGKLDISSSQLYFTGSVDELAVWSEALSADEIALLASGFISGPDGDGDQVLVTDGAGGSHFGQANGNAIADEAIVNRHVATGADIDVLKLAHPGGTTDFLRADGTWAPAGGDPSTDTQVWMPLVDSDGTVVLDDTGVIPTLITLA